MAEVVGLATGIISLASLFTTCVDCFEYYKAAKDCPRRLRMLLVKLDFEKTRLLLWANNIGLVSTDSDSRDSGIEQHEELIRRGLEEIMDLLAEASEMSERYGVKKRLLEDGVTEEEDLRTDVVSHNSMSLFRTSYRRFRGQNPSVAELERRTSLSDRIRWAVTDKGKFEGLIISLREFVDNLYLLVPVDRQVQNRLVEDDIFAVTDLEELELIQEATEDSYRIWSEVASQAIERSERGTMFTGGLRRADTDKDINLPTRAATFDRAQAQAQAQEPSGKFSNIPRWKTLMPPVIVILTSKCIEFSDPEPCVDTDFGTRVTDVRVDRMAYHKWNESKNRFDVGSRIRDQLSVGNWTRDDVQDFWKKDSNSRSVAGMCYYYVPVCERAIQEAYACILEGSALFSANIRVDDRLRCSCCSDRTDLANRLLALRDQIETALAKPERGGLLKGRISVSGYFDRMWLEQRIYEADVDDRGVNADSSNEPFKQFMGCLEEASYVDWETISGIIIVGEDDHLRQMLTSKAFRQHPHVPSEAEVYAIRGNGIFSSGSENTPLKSQANTGLLTRHYMGRYQQNLKLVKRKEFETNRLPELQGST